MRQKHSESAQEQRIALYKSDHHGNMCHLRTLSWLNCVTSKQCLHTMCGITFLIFKELAFSMHALPKNDGLAPASKRNEITCIQNYRILHWLHFQFRTLLSPVMFSGTQCRKHRQLPAATLILLLGQLDMQLPCPIERGGCVGHGWVGHFVTVVCSQFC